MKGLLFFGLLLIVLLVASFALAKETTKPNEGFVNPGSNASLLAPAIVVPQVNPKPTVLEGTTPAPYLPPAEISYGPALGEIARVNTLPYNDPALEAAPYKRLAELKESLQAFFTFEAKGLEKMSDPEVQLPLTTARGDLSRLTDEISVLKRNPGIGSSLTQGQADDIRANLIYLQRKYRLSVNSASGTSSQILEGFADALLGEGDRLTLKDLKDLRVSVLAEITRLSASGTTDPVINARIDSLNTIKNNIDTIVTEVENGTRLESQIPIMKMDVKKFLPLMSDPSEPLPQLLNENNLPASAANVFPAYESGDKSGAKMAQNLYERYGDAVFNGLSWDLGLKYTAPHEVALEAAKAVQALPALTPSQQGFKMTGGLHEPKTENTFMNATGPEDPRYPSSNTFRGEMEAVTATAESQRLDGKTPKVMGAAAKFDWREKASNICESIRKRGLNPEDFGCSSSSRRVSPDYSWRGEARMVCTRLLTTPDPGLPETCGCPPTNWPGWRS
jgi:hypothetical protein